VRSHQVDCQPIFSRPSWSDNIYYVARRLLNLWQEILSGQPKFRPEIGPISSRKKQMQSSLENHIDITASSPGTAATTQPHIVYCCLYSDLCIWSSHFTSRTFTRDWGSSFFIQSRPILLIRLLDLLDLLSLSAFLSFSDRSTSSLSLLPALHFAEYELVGE